MSSSTSSKSSRNRRSSILKVRQTTVETTVDVAEQPKNRRRVSFHHQKTVKEYDKEKHELSATSPLKETVKEAMSDFDSTKSNSTMMSLGTPDRTTGENNTMMLFRGMMSGGRPSSIHHETKDMSFSIIEDDQNETLNVFKGMDGASHMSIHSKTVDISYKMEESLNENHADDTMNVFGKPSANHSTRTMSNMTMDMDISKADNTLTEGGYEGNDTMAIFGTGPKTNDTTIPHDNTMDILTGTNGSSQKSCMSQSILMEMSANPSPVSSQDHTMAMFEKGAQADENVAMVEVTMIDEEKKIEIPLSSSPIHPSTTIHSKTPIESQSLDLDDTMGVFGMAKAQEMGDDDIPMDISLAVVPLSTVEGDGSPTMNLFKRKGDDEMEEQTMHIFASKRWKENGDTFVGENGEQGGSEELKESQETPGGSQKSEYMDEVDATMKIFGGKMDDTMDMSVAIEGKEGKEDETKKDESIMEISTRTAVEGSSEKSVVSPLPSSDGDRTFDVFNGVGDTSQIDVTETNSTFDVVKSGGNSSQMDLSVEENETLGIFGKKEDEVEEEQDETTQEEQKKDEIEGKNKDDEKVEKKEEEKEEEEKVEEKKEEKEEEEEEKMIHETRSANQSISDDNSLPDDNGSADMEDVTPPSQSPLFNRDRRKTRLSTVIEVSSRYTAASSQSMRERVESTDEESKEEGILAGMEGMEEEGEELVDERGEEEKQLEMDEQKSERMEDESMVDSASPSGNNTTFSTTFTKRSMLDETRLSDRSILDRSILRRFDDMVLETVEWMRNHKENEEGEMNEILRVEASGFIQKSDQAIQRSEIVVDGLLSSDIIQLNKSDLLAQSIMKLNSSKVQEHRLLFEWARREAQREWWEERAEKAENVNEELERRMKREGEELKKAKDDLIMMNKLNELKEDVESMEKEVEVGRGLNRNTIDELIGASKKKEEEKERLQREVNRMELERMKESTIILKMMTERCNAVDESIKRKMDEREKNKRELRAYLSQLTNNLK